MSEYAAIEDTSQTIYTIIIVSYISIHRILSLFFWMIFSIFLGII